MSTVYVSTAAELPFEKMANLCEGAEFSTNSFEGVISEYVYEWPAFTLHVNISRLNEISVHIEELIGYLFNIQKSVGGNLDEQLLERFRETKLVLGFWSSPDTEGGSDLLHDALGTIAYNTKSLIFWEGKVYDENASLLFPQKENTLY